MNLDKPQEFNALVRRLGKAPTVLMGKEMDKVLGHLAHKAQDFMVNGIKAGRPEWPPLSEFTKKMKGSDRRLVDTGEFVGSITVWDDGGKWFAGVPDSSPAAMKAAVHENGAHVPVTEGVRGFFRSQGLPLRQDTRFVRVPPRPWLKPAEAELAVYAESNLDALVEPLMQKITEG